MPSRKSMKKLKACILRIACISFSREVAPLWFKMYFAIHCSLRESISSMCMQESDIKILREFIQEHIIRSRYIILEFSWKFKCHCQKGCSICRRNLRPRYNSQGIGKQSRDTGFAVRRSKERKEVPQKKRFQKSLVRLYVDWNVMYISAKKKQQSRTMTTNSVFVGGADWIVWFYDDETWIESFLVNQSWDVTSVWIPSWGFFQLET